MHVGFFLNKNNLRVFIVVRVWEQSYKNYLFANVIIKIVSFLLIS